MIYIYFLECFEGVYLRGRVGCYLVNVQIVFRGDFGLPES